jgi:protection-of-telomeres protein 1
VPLHRILKQEFITDRSSGKDVGLPFINCNYKANVRVVGYAPSKLEDFAVGRRESVYDMLSDYSGGEDTDTEEFKRSWTAGKGAPRKVWVWRFGLEVEDASKKGQKQRMWLWIDNPSAQGLLSMDAEK